MNTRNSLIMLLISILLVNLSCIPLVAPEVQRTPTPVTAATGSVSGKVNFSNNSSHGGIEVFLESLEIAKTASIQSKTGSNSQKGINARTVTNEEGVFLISGLPVGSYTLYARSENSLEGAVRANITVSKNRTTKVDDLILTALGDISGKITCDDNSSNLLGTLVFIAGTSYMATCDSAGTFTIKNVPAGKDYLLLAIKNGMEFPGPIVEIKSGEETKTPAFHIAIQDMWITGTGVPSVSTGGEGAFYIDITTSDVYRKTNSLWVKLLSLKGADGNNGADGLSLVWKGSYPAAPESPAVNWAYYNTTAGKAYIYTTEGWSILSQDGANGIDGTDGFSIVWKGSLAAAPGLPVENWAYYDTTAGKAYIYTSKGWSILSRDGVDGVNGTAGTDGSDGTNGSDGKDGTNGVSIMWRGSFESAPDSPLLNWAYYNKNEGQSYIYDGLKWTVMTKDGTFGSSDYSKYYVVNFLRRVMEVLGQKITILETKDSAGRVINYAIKTRDGKKTVLTLALTYDSEGYLSKVVVDLLDNGLYTMSHTYKTTFRFVTYFSYGLNNAGFTITVEANGSYYSFANFAISGNLYSDTNGSAYSVTLHSYGITGKAVFDENKTARGVFGFNGNNMNAVVEGNDSNNTIDLRLFVDENDSQNITYNENAMLQSIASFNKGSLVYGSFYEYGPDNLRSGDSSYYGEELQGSSRYTYYPSEQLKSDTSYDSDGKMRWKSEYDYNGTHVSEQRNYNALNLMTQKTEHFYLGDLKISTDVTLYQYDGNTLTGYTKKEGIGFDPYNSQNCKRELVYNGDGKILSITEDILYTENTHVTTYSYDENGTLQGYVVTKNRYSSDPSRFDNSTVFTAEDKILVYVEYSDYYSQNITMYTYDNSTGDLEKYKKWIGKSTTGESFTSLTEYDSNDKELWSETNFTQNWINNVYVYYTDYRLNTYDGSGNLLYYEIWIQRNRANHNEFLTEKRYNPDGTVQAEP